MNGLHMSKERLPRRWLSPLVWLTATLAIQLVGLVLWGLTWPGQAPVELSFVVPQDEVRPWKTVVAEFEANHPTIRINLVANSETTYTTDQRKAIYSADFQAAAAQYDLAYLDIVWMPQFADELINLLPLIQRDRLDLSDFLPSELRAGTVGDGLYRLPMRADLGVLYYRKDWLEQLELPLPTTLLDLKQVIAALKNKNQGDLGYLWQGRSYEGLVANFVEVMHGVGATWIDPSTNQVGLNSSAALQAATRLQALVQQELSPPIVTDYTEQTSLEAFKQEQAAFLRGWPYFRSELQGDRWQDAVAIALPFSFSATPGAGCRGGWGFGIPRNAAHPEEAWEAIKYLTSPAAQRQFVLESGFLPSRRSLFDDPDIVARYPLMPQFLDYLQNSSIFRPAIPQYDVASEILQTALGKILRGQQSVKAAMDQAQKATEALMS